MQRIISFSLWGKQDKYLQGAIENVKLQKEIYPGWTCRFYVDKETVPLSVLHDLNRLDAEIFLRDNNIGPQKQNCTAIFWRYEVMTNEYIERFIIRDADSRLNWREKGCVDEWLKEKTSLHIMRDHPHHRHRIVSGMWGGLNKKTSRLNYYKLLQDWRKIHPRGNNQHFLAEKIYPKFSFWDRTIHDSFKFFRDERAVAKRFKRNDNYFVGQKIEV